MNGPVEHPEELELRTPDASVAEEEPEGHAAPYQEEEDDDDDDDNDLYAGTTTRSTTARRINNNDNSMMIPVGITIAYKRQATGTVREETIPHSSSLYHHHHGMTKEEPVGHMNSNGTTTTTTTKHSSSSTQQQWQVFVDCTLIYIVCLIFPSVIGYAYQCFMLWKQEQTTTTTLVPTEAQDQSNGLYDYLFGESSLYRWFVREVYQPEISAWCDGHVMTTKTTTTTLSPPRTSYDYYSTILWSYVSYATQYVGLCPPPSTTNNIPVSVLSNDVLAWSDTFSITVFSFIIAILRITIVHWTVPLDDSQELEAMVRCKSMHLLSADYVVTPVCGTPVRPRRIITTTTTTTTTTHTLQMPLIDTNNAMESNNNNIHNLETDESSAAFLMDDSVTVHLETIGSGGPQPYHHNYAVDTKEEADVDNFDEQLLEKLAQASNTKSNGNRSRMYAGPRYATALFRLFYSTFAAFIALFFFRSADFWPWYVLGQGNSKQCWDLSGGLAVAMDSDFDQRNYYLKQYFLWQASYHWHSAAFHILSMLILILHPTKHAPRRFMSLQKETTMYIRRLFQHALAVLLIAIAYVFSSLRRLGAIGLFAFDVSSCCLHLLQLCINAPEDSRWSRTSTIAGVFWILVVPSFVLARFIIWPAIWYSAAFESTAWLQQLEKTLWPGSAAVIRYAIHSLMAALEVLSFIYFRRLFNHDHVKRVLDLGVHPNTAYRTKTNPITSTTRKVFAPSRGS